MHQRIVYFKRGVESKRNRLEEEREVNTREFRAYFSTLDMVNSFQYLAKVIFPEDYN